MICIRLFVISLGLLLSALWPNKLIAQKITTITGNGTQGYSGDGGPSLGAENRGPSGVAVDKTGNVYFADPLNNVIRKIDVSGIITTCAGTGVGGYSGDGGPAIAAQMINPSYLSIDDQGNLYFVDYDVRVRKINTQGIISTIAGNGTYGYTGDGGPAINASFNFIFGAVPDHNGNIYLSDYENQVIRKIDPAGTITTIAGTGIAGFSGDGGLANLAQLNYPGQVAFDRLNNLYIPDGHNGRIRKINGSGVITTIAGSGSFGYSGDGGPAILAKFNGVYSISVDNAGDLYLADQNNEVIRKIDCAGIITTYAGKGVIGYNGDGGPAISAKLNNPICVGTDVLGNVYISDQDNMAVRKVDNQVIPTIISQPSKAEICAGTTAIFQTTFPSPGLFQWQIKSGNNWVCVSDNSVYKGTATAAMQIVGASVSMNGNIYRCVMATSCSFYLSLEDTLFVSGGLPLSVTISTPSDSVCAGTQVTFEASIGNDLKNLKYQWEANGIPIGKDTTIYTNSFLVDKDVIRCSVTDIAGCSVPSTVWSNSIEMQVFSHLDATLEITTNANEICAGDIANYKADITNGGDKPAFQWEVNGFDAGNNSDTFSSGSVQNGDIINCQMSSSLGCVSSVKSINSISMVVNPRPSLFVGNDTLLAPGKSVQLNPEINGAIASFLWSPVTGLDNSNIQNPLASPVFTTTYQLDITDFKGCKASGKLTIGIFYRMNMPNAFSPNGDGINDIFRVPPALPVKIISFSIFNRWGNRIFFSNDRNKGWDGTFNHLPQQMDSYVWILKYVDPVSGKSETDSGAVILTR